MYPSLLISYSFFFRLRVHLFQSLMLTERRCLALPAVLAHSGAIKIPAMVMSILGGLLIYGTIISFSMFFKEQEEF
jgi:hypothetical protein